MIGIISLRQLSLQECAACKVPAEPEAVPLLERQRRERRFAFAYHNTC